MKTHHLNCGTMSLPARSPSATCCWSRPTTAWCSSTPGTDCKTAPTRPGSDRRATCSGRSSTPRRPPPDRWSARLPSRRRPPHHRDALRRRPHRRHRRLPRRPDPRHRGRGIGRDATADPPGEGPLPPRAVGARPQDRRARAGRRGVAGVRRGQGARHHRSRTGLGVAARPYPRARVRRRRCRPSMGSALWRRVLLPRHGGRAVDPCRSA